MFRKILVAVDESSSAQRAIQIATELAQQFGSSVCLLHAVPHIADHLGSPVYERLLHANVLQGNTLLDRAVGDVGTSVPVETQLIEGPPAGAILRVAETEGYNLIVMGSRGNNPIVNMLLGSVSAAVSQKAPCPVMIIH